MAIKLPDPGNGIPEDKTGNDEWTNMKIVRENFADKSNAASRLVGKSSGNLPEFEKRPDGTVSIAGAGYAGTGERFEPAVTAKDTEGKTKEVLRALYDKGSCIVHNMIEGNHGGRFNTLAFHKSANTYFSLAVPHNVSQNGIRVASGYWSGSDLTVITQTLYTDKNTTVDSNKNIKTSSPVVRVFSDHLDKIHEANDLPIKYIRNGVGDYTIEGTTGLRENDWQIVIPKDDHDNQLIAFTLEDDNGTISLKTYKRIFNMNTFMFEPDLNTPLDIPEGRWVDLHFNDLPVKDEVVDESII